MTSRRDVVESLDSIDEEYVRFVDRLNISPGLPTSYRSAYKEGTSYRPIRISSEEHTGPCGVAEYLYSSAKHGSCIVIFVERERERERGRESSTNDISYYRVCIDVSEW